MLYLMKYVYNREDNLIFLWFTNQFTAMSQKTPKFYKTTCEWKLRILNKSIDNQISKVKYQFIQSMIQFRMHFLG